MTINDIARMALSRERYQRQMAQPKLENGSLPPKGHVNPYYPACMNVTGMKASDFKDVPVSKEVETQVKDIAFQHMKRNYGMTDPNRSDLADAIKAYISKIPEQDRVHAARAVTRIHREEAIKLEGFVKSRVPGWQYGQAFDTSILDEYQQGNYEQGFDIKV